MSPDRTEAYEKLDAILAREEFQEYVSPLAWIVQIVDRIQEWYEGLPLWVQIVFLVLLTAVLVAILAHMTWVILTASRTGRAGRAPGGMQRTVADLPPPDRLGDLASAALEAGDRAEALRLWYLAALSRLRDLGVIPPSTALTGREIVASTRDPVQGLGEATRLFERSVYGAIPPSLADVETVRALSRSVG